MKLETGDGYPYMAQPEGPQWVAKQRDAKKFCSHSDAAEHCEERGFVVCAWPSIKIIRLRPRVAK